MGKLVVTEFISLDGVVEDPGGSETFAHGGWTFTFDQGPDGPPFKRDELDAAGAQLLGRVTYEAFAKAWPAMEEEYGEFGRKFNAMPKYVVSQTLETADWKNSTIVRGDLADEVAVLKEQYDSILVSGSATLVRGLLALGLVDELRLMIFPVLLGTGMRLFGDGDLTRFTITESKHSGEVQLLVLAKS